MPGQTPEGRVKKKIRMVLDKYKCHNIYYYMPVPGGFGVPTLDYLGFLKGQGFAIEAKRPGGKPTERQLGTLTKIAASGAAVFVIDGDAALGAFDAWLDAVSGG